jgi:hypothetical protein
VNEEGRPEEGLTASEERLVRLLRLLRVDTPRNGATLPADVVRTASWQLSVRRVAIAASDMIVAAGQTLATVLGLRPSSRRD